MKNDDLNINRKIPEKLSIFNQQKPQKNTQQTQNKTKYSLFCTYGTLQFVNIMNQIKKDLKVTILVKTYFLLLTG
jgi:hypothetical protein